MNLRDQLLKAGLVNKKQADAAARDARKQQKVEQGHALPKHVLAQQEAERIAREEAAKQEARLRARREAEEAGRRETVRLQTRHILASHRIRFKPGPQRFYHRSPDRREAWRLRVPERIADDLRLGRMAIAYIEPLIPGDPADIVVIDRETADRVEALRPELILFRNRGPIDRDPAEQLYED